MRKSEEDGISGEDDPYWFEELFYRDLESWFSSDIACCDECYDDFLEHWPHAYSADKAAFQCSSIDMDSFYSGSRLRDSYTKKEFDALIKTISCPRCGNQLRYNIWPYTFPFEVIDGFEGKIYEISKIARSTPFLLLKHPFAGEVHRAINDIGKEVEPKAIGANLFRARELATLKGREMTEFDFPPKDIVTEGRYNHAGMPVLYLASDPATCFHELRGVPCVIAEISILRDIKVLDLTKTYESHQKYNGLLGTLVYSALMSARQDSAGWHRPKYVFSRFISDCVRAAGLDAIKYPSTRRGDDCFNIVVFNDELSLKNGSRLVRLISYEKDQISDHDDA